jgi:hypothetical protein
MDINLKRVIIGGLVAGIVILLCGSALVPLVGKDMDMALARFNLPPLSVGAMVYFVFTSLITGIVLVWMYAAMLPRLKHRTKTAISAAMILWLLAYFFANVAMVAYGFMPVKLTVIGTAWGLIETLAGGLIGTRFYKEKSPEK